MLSLCNAEKINLGRFKDKENKEEQKRFYQDIKHVLDANIDNIEKYNYLVVINMMFNTDFYLDNKTLFAESEYDDYAEGG